MSAAAGAGRHFLGDFVMISLSDPPPDCAAPGWKLRAAREGRARGRQVSARAVHVGLGSSRQKRWGASSQTLPVPERSSCDRCSVEAERSAQLVRGERESGKSSDWAVPRPMGSRYQVHRSATMVAIQYSKMKRAARPCAYLSSFSRELGAPKTKGTSTSWRYQGGEPRPTPPRRTPRARFTRRRKRLHEEVTHIESTATRCQRGSHGTSRAPLE